MVGIYRQKRRLSRKGSLDKISAFLNTRLPGKNEEGEKSEKAQYSIAVSAVKKDAGEIIWFAAPNILTDEDNTLTGGGNYSYFSALLAILCEKDSVSFASKLLEEDVLTISAGQASFWAIILIAVIPSVFVICGIVKVRKRRRGIA